ncbi:hypothetical protein PDM28_14150 [Stenotrophomonas aracearum]|uniref:Secreted protein n=1 Tax=Stenotrophomonas aracearum TaxID=3003272 RepID=A0ABY9YBM3_9GAMM|nr:hypothetical protein [Stenotrophomonas sp. A5588]WNH47813.1 hypothetical protein PDM28_14150 [Stenotrophomonas sp. A5588]
MTIALSRAPLVAALFASATALAQPAPVPEVRTPPAPHCLDARAVRQMEQASPDAIAVLGSNGQAYRLDFATACPGVNDAEQVRLDAPDGWACGRPSERLVVDGRSCPLSAVSVLDNRSFAEVARESSRQFATTLEAVTVTAKGAATSERRQAFRGSPEFCFATRNVRGWSEDPNGVVVETNPRRNGGHKFYRVELGSSCSILAGATEVDFQSGFQNGLICGNPGDRIVMQPSGIENDGRSYTPRFARPGCAVMAVYPKE